MILPPALGQTDSSVSKKSKRRVGVEFFGNPLSLHFERQIHASGDYKLYAGFGVGIPMALLGEMNVSLSMNTCYQVNPRISLFGLVQAQLQSLAFPQVPVGPAPGSGYVPGRNYLGVNTLAFSFALGVSFHFGNWAFSPLYPAYNYNYGSFAGEEVNVAWYSSLSLNSRMYYLF